MANIFVFFFIFLSLIICLYYPPDHPTVALAIILIISACLWTSCYIFDKKIYEIEYSDWL